MPYLIDGNNFIGFISQSELWNPQSRYSLIGKLLAFQKIKKTRIYLVFDGPPDRSITEKKFPQRILTVFYPDFDQNADDVIRGIIARQTDRRQFFVVSSDREIKNFARSKGAKSLDNREFNRQLKKALKEYRKLRADEKNASLPSPLEVSFWMDIFRE
jgi:predicted RNA-binding protein with PIN domain